MQTWPIGFIDVQLYDGFIWKLSLPINIAMITVIRNIPQCLVLLYTLRFGENRVIKFIYSY